MKWLAAGHGPAYIAKTLKYNRSTVYKVYNSFKAEGKVKRKAHKSRSDKKRTPTFLAGLKRSINASPGTSMSVLAKKEKCGQVISLKGHKE